MATVRSSFMWRLRAAGAPAPLRIVGAHSGRPSRPFGLSVHGARRAGGARGARGARACNAQHDTSRPRPSALRAYLVCICGASPAAHMGAHGLRSARSARAGGAQRVCGARGRRAQAAHGAGWECVTGRDSDALRAS